MDSPNYTIMTSIKVLKNLFEKESMKDVTLQVDGDERQIKAHRLILIGASKYFETLLMGDFIEKDSKLVTIQGMNFETLEMLITFIYTEELQFSDKCSLKDCFLAADYLMIDLALERLNSYVMDNISLEIAMDILNLEGNVAVEVYEKAMEFFCNNLDIRRDIPALTLDQLKTVVKHLQKSPESKLTEVCIKSVLKWIRESRSEREKHTFELLSIIEFRTVVNIKFMIENLIPHCKDNKSLKFVIALMARQGGYTGDFTQKYLKDKKV